VQKETHSDHRDDNANGAKNNLGWRDAGDFLRKIQGLDGHIERGEDVRSTFLSLGVGFHGLKVDIAGEKAVVGCEESQYRWAAITPAHHTKCYSRKRPRLDVTDGTNSNMNFHPPSSPSVYSLCGGSFGLSGREKIR
jgi:hypothetical protein